MRVVARQPVFAMLVEKKAVSIQRRQASSNDLDKTGGVERHMFIGIGHITGSGQQECHFLFLAGQRADSKRNVVFFSSRVESRGIQSTFHRCWDSQLKV